MTFVPDCARSLRAQSQIAHREDADTLISAPLNAAPPSRRNGGSCPTPDSFVLARCLTAREGNRQDGESQTFVLFENHAQDSRVKAVRAKPSLPQKAGTGGNNLPLMLHENLSGDYCIRRLTPRECERLQGFPDDWTAWGVAEDGGRVEISDSARYRMLGNAVAVPVVEWIGRALLEQLT